MDLQSIAVYVIVIVAAFFAVRAVFRAARGKATLPSCPGCDEADRCRLANRVEEKE